MWIEVPVEGQVELEFAPLAESGRLGTAPLVATDIPGSGIALIYIDD